MAGALSEELQLCLTNFPTGQNLAPCWPGRTSPVKGTGRNINNWQTDTDQKNVLFYFDYKNFFISSQFSLFTDFFG